MVKDDWVSGTVGTQGFGFEPGHFSNTQNMPSGFAACQFGGLNETKL
jgi:hypothetical protein